MQEDFATFKFLIHICNPKKKKKKKEEFILDEVDKRGTPTLPRLAGGDLFFGCGCVQHQRC